MKNNTFNIFLIHKENCGIIFELFDTNKPLNFSFLKMCVSFKKIICKNDILELKDFIVTYGVYSRSLVFLLHKFFNLKMKFLLFPFFFRFKVYSINNTIKNKIFLFFIEFIVNFYLVFK
jgi:hypothetical protein